MKKGRNPVLLLVLVCTSAAHAAWIVTEVPVQPGWTGGIEVTDINSTGVVCGNGNYVVNTSSTPYRFDGSTVTELAHLVPADPISLTTGINAAGVICGYSHNLEGDSQAVYWDTTLHTIPYPPDANTNSDIRAYDINDAGVIVGYFWNTNGQRTAFYYSGGTTYSLDAALKTAGLGGVQNAAAVNNNNVICGIADDFTNTSTPYTYDIATGTVTVLGRIGVDDCSAVDINASGHTIGRGKFFSYDQYFRAVLYDGSWHFVDNAEPATQWGQAINDHDRTVGNSGINANRVSWYSDAPGDGSVRYLNLPGWSRLSAQAINNNDWIAGLGWTTTSGGENRGFIAAPPPGDGDHDGDIDLADLNLLAGCLGGPHEAAGFVSPSAGCLRDFDFAPADGDVDLEDYAAFARIFEGP